MPSIGSLGVFHRLSGKNYGFFYMAADSAEPLSSPKRKYAKLKTKSGCPYRIINGYTECIYAGCVFTFAQALYALEIGTPIEPQNCINAKDKNYRNIFRGWLRSVLYSHSQMTNNASLAADLLSQLESDYEGPLMSEPPTTLILNCDDV